MGAIFVNTKEPPKSTISPFSVWMAMASYEDHVNPDNVEVYLVDSMNPKAFPLRAHFKKPEVHPEHPDYRLCPNFPEIYINSSGSILDEDSITTFSTLGHKNYVIAFVPGRNKCCAVNRFRIYADAWGPEWSAIRQYRTIPCPRNGNWQDYSQKNVLWDYEAYSSIFNGKPVTKTELIDGDTFRSVDFSSVPEMLSTFGSPMHKFVPSGLSGGKFGFIITLPPRNNYDYCYDHYWTITLHDCATGETEVATSHKEVRGWLKQRGIVVSKNLIRRIHKQPDVVVLSKEYLPVFFKDWFIDSKVHNRVV